MSLTDLFVSTKQTQGSPSVAGSSENRNPVDYLSGLFNRGADLYTSGAALYDSISGKKKPAAAPVAKATPVSDNSKTVWWIVGGVAVIALIIIFLRK